MRAPAFIILASCVGAACGGAPKRDPDPVEPPRTQLQIRQNAACEQAGPRIIECAITDLKATSTPAELAQLDLDKMRAANIHKFSTTCTGATMSSRQVRVYEVCLKAETECEPFITCLDNVKPQK